MTHSHPYGPPVGVRPAAAPAAAAADPFLAAIRLHQAGQLAEAERAYRHILTVVPDHAPSLNNLGLIAGPGEAMQLFRRALAALPDYADAHINLGNALRQAGNRAEAILHFRRALALKPGNAGLHHVVGQMALEDGRIDEAEVEFRQTIALQPDHVEAMMNLGTIYRARGRLDEAVATYRRALFLHPDHPGIHFLLAALLHARGDLEGAAASYRVTLAAAPGHVESLNNLGLILQAQGRRDDAAALFTRAIEIDPTMADAHNNLGDIHKERGELNEAAACYLQAVSHKPDHVIALCNLGTIHAIGGKFPEAAEWYRHALALDPSIGVANMNLASILECNGKLAEAQVFRARAPRPQPLISEAATTPRRSVLILAAAGDGNVPIETLIPLRVNARHKWNVECATDDQEATLPPFDVAFNAIGNADLALPSLPRASAFVARCKRTVLNPPERILPTRRDRMPALLGGLPGVVVPPVTRLTGAEAAAPDLEARLAAAGLSFPMLVRPISGQGGAGVVLAEEPGQLRGLDYAAADAWYFIGYYDYRSADGFFRKYRTIFVDRKPHPYHLAISPKWLVHYFSAEMLAEPWKREEERRFLETPAQALGPVAAAAVDAIGKAMDLDYCGCDYSVLADGRVLVFEANATMSVVAPDAGDFPYKVRHVQAIYDAWEAMLARHGARPDRAPAR